MGLEERTLHMDSLGRQHKDLSMTEVEKQHTDSKSEVKT